MARTPHPSRKGAKAPTLGLSDQLKIAALRHSKHNSGYEVLPEAALDYLLIRFLLPNIVGLFQSTFATEMKAGPTPVEVSFPLWIARTTVSKSIFMPHLLTAVIRFDPTKTGP